MSYFVLHSTMDNFLSILPESKCTSPVLACVFLTISYVASLYVWRTKLSRDHPSTIKRRFFSVSCIMLITPFFTQLMLSESSLNKGDILKYLGLRSSGILQAIFIPLFLTATLFLGPLTMQCMSGIWKLYTEPIYWIQCSQDLLWVRNHIMAPLSEEWVFRACMLPMLVQCLEPMTAVFVAPLLFGIAHFHHMLEQIRSGMPFVNALMISTFQFLYTSLFGAYSAYLFLRTGHFAAPLVAHMFCNHMGFPNFGEVFQYQALQRVVIIFNFLLGFTLWCFMIEPLTKPEIYDNRLYWDT